MEATLNNNSHECPFCQPDGILLENELAYAKPDKFPVNPGHLLIITKRHVANYFHTTDEEKLAILSLVDEAKRYLDEKHAPAGYNIGVNVGEIAGQTIMHVHLHLIPRFHGDTANPRGGVRGVIPSRQSY
jgi:diadenosine tetraphosphate (Ap4A) HIT family hydrolase